MAKGAYFTCPNCGKQNFVTFPQIKKNLKGDIPIAFACGCSLSPHKVLDELAKIVTQEFRKTYPESPK